MKYCGVKGTEQKILSKEIEAVKKRHGHNRRALVDLGIWGCLDAWMLDAGLLIWDRLAQIERVGVVEERRRRRSQCDNVFFLAKKH
jgi:hypothetical protein